MSLHSGPDTNAPRVRVRQVRVSYAERRVLDGIDFDIRAGELVALLGPSGCGKSTLLRIIAGLQQPESGEVAIDGDLVRGTRPDIALAFQDPCLLPWLSVERNVAFGMGFSRQPNLPRHVRRERATTALNQVGLAHARQYSPRQLSGGMAQRVGLARCLARKPHTLLLDEPFGALDEITRADMQRLLVGLVRDTGPATLLVTHDIDEALLISDRIVVIGHRGKPVLQLSVDIASPRDAHLEMLSALRIQILQALRDPVAHSAPATST